MAEAKTMRLHGLGMRAKFVLGVVMAMLVVIAVDFISVAWASYHLHLAVMVGLVILVGAASTQSLSKITTAVARIRSMNGNISKSADQQVSL